MQLSDLMEQDAKKQFSAPQDSDLKSIGELATRQVALESFERAPTIQQLIDLDPSVPELEAALVQKKKELANLREVLLPNALAQFGIADVGLLDGSRVTVKEEIYAGITEENRDPAFKWLEETNNDGIIKNEIKCPFGKGQDNTAKLLAALLAERGYSFVQSRSVHPQTLKAFVRKQLEDAKPIPTDVFSIHVKKVSTVKLK